MSYCVSPGCAAPINAEGAVYYRICGSELLLHGRYRPFRLLGKGGFGQTFLAIDESPPLPDDDSPTLGQALADLDRRDRRCVIKQLRTATLDPKVVEMAQELFRREAKSLARLSGYPKLPRLLDSFQISTEFYLVQEYVHGHDLQQLIRQQGALSEAEVEQFLGEILPIVQHIHQQKIIHRDIKPSNIIRREPDHALVLIDFGAVKDQITRDVASVSEWTVLTAYAVGTPGYAPPEQMALRPVYASDICALGMTCLFLLTDKSPNQLGHNPVIGDLLLPKGLQLQGRLAAVLPRMLTVQIDRRYPSAEAVMATVQFKSLTQGAVYKSENLIMDVNQPDLNAPDQLPQELASKVVLAIDDDDNIRELVQEILTAEGFTVHQAENGQAAIKLASDLRPDLILCDVNMPQLDGYGVLAALQADPTLATIPFIFLTARAERSEFRRGMVSGADDYLTKPFTHQDLLEAIQARLGKQAIAQQTKTELTPAQAAKQVAAIAELQKAIQNQEFLLLYQPQYSLENNQLTGVEVLVRWQSPDRGLISPAQFIPLAEETGLILPLGEWVLWRACQQAKAWQQAGILPVRVAVNLSARQFNYPTLVNTVNTVLAQTGLEPQYLELELTESLLVRNVEATIARLGELKAAGIRIAIDDFGTGYASLGYLQHFPFDVLKIDQCFVRGIDQNPKNTAIVTAIIQMAHSLGLCTIAEGVETEAEQHILKTLTCDEVQGYLLSRPLTAAALEPLLIAATQARANLEGTKL